MGFRSTKVVSILVLCMVVVIAVVVVWGVYRKKTESRKHPDDSSYLQPIENAKYRKMTEG